MDPINTQLFKSSTKDPGEFLFNMADTSRNYGGVGGFDVCIIGKDHYLICAGRTDVQSYRETTFICLSNEGVYRNAYSPYSPANTRRVTAGSVGHFLTRFGENHAAFSASSFLNTSTTSSVPDGGIISIFFNPTTKHIYQPSTTESFPMLYYNSDRPQSAEGSFVQIAGQADPGFYNNHFIVARGGDNQTIPSMNGVVSMPMQSTSTDYYSELLDAEVFLTGGIYSPTHQKYILYGGRHIATNTIQPFIGVAPANANTMRPEGRWEGFITTTGTGVSVIHDAEYDPAQEVVWSGGMTHFAGYPTVIFNRTYQPFDPATRLVSYNYNYGISNAEHFLNRYCHAPPGAHTAIRGYHIAQSFGGGGSTGTATRSRLFIAEDRYGDLLGEGYWAGTNLIQPTTTAMRIKPCPFNPKNYLLMIYASGSNIVFMRVRYSSLLSGSSFSFHNPTYGNYCTWTPSNDVIKYAGQNQPSGLSYGFTNANCAYTRGTSAWSSTEIAMSARQMYVRQ